ncbi:MAG TPA: hypothetical protein VFX29_08210 [Longimicrobiaceae bacterium]|jgi:hypothetical protein|nr:hypothetical protein [Longimicrobiaceae bacterium]
MARGLPDEDRRRILRRMEWTFVWLPPLLLVLVTAAGSALIAWMAPVAGTTFLGRWAFVAALVLAVPVLGMLIRRLFRK